VREALEWLANRPSTAQKIAQRARILLGAIEGQRNVELVQALGVQRNCIGKWRSRWAKAQEKLLALSARLEPEGSSCALRKLADAIAQEILDDAPRSGSPPRVHR
jgi:ABC-type protease/lipase transport system fused ATPase/permease subunit